MSVERTVYSPSASACVRLPRTRRKGASKSGAAAIGASGGKMPAMGTTAPVRVSITAHSVLPSSSGSSPWLMRYSRTQRCSDGAMGRVASVTSSSMPGRRR